MRGARGDLIVGAGLALVSVTATAAPFWSFPDPVTPIARDTAAVHNLFMAVIMTLFLTVLAIMLYSFWKHRKSQGHQAATFTEPTSRRQWMWVLAPFAGLLILDYGVFGVPAYKAVLSYEDTQNNAELVVKVTGSQWLWQYEYPKEGVKFASHMATPRDQINNKAPKGENYLLEVDNPLVLPVGKKVRFITTSNDVIHSWWVPAFGVKRDAVPGFLREFWVKVEKTGTYRGQCSELCGKEHGFMPVVVNVVPEPEYKAWIAKQQTAVAAEKANATASQSLDDLKTRGEKVYAASCTACHQANGQGVPNAFPSLVATKLITGPVEEHIKVVLNGRPNTAMAAWSKQLSDAEIAAVVTYERNAWGNKGEPVQAATVAALRAAR